MILCVGGTPAMQRTLFFESLVPGEVNRAERVVVTASGKVTNAARVATTLGSRAVFVSFLGGDSGRFVAEKLDEKGVSHDAVWTKSQTRTCSTLLHDSGEVTELVEEAKPVSAEEASALERAVRNHLSVADALCLIGSLPPGAPDDFYARLVEAANYAGVPSLVDAQGEPLLKALAARPFIVKPNLEEAVATLGMPENSTALDAARSLVEYGARWAVVTDGARGAALANDSGGAWRIEPPKVEAVNPIGSGDSMAAGLLRSIASGASVPEAVAYGAACAAANVLTETSGVVKKSEVERLVPEVRVRKENYSVIVEGRGEC